MLTKVFCVYDSKSLAYGVPFFSPTVGAAVRAFSDLCNDRSTTLNRHPGDFVLFEVASYDDQKGLVQPIKHIHLGLAADFVVKAPASPRAIDMITREAIDNPLSTAAEIDSVVTNGGK